MPDFGDWDLRPVILEVAIEVVRHRAAAAEPDADGFAGAVTYTDANVMAHVEPAGKEQLRRLPEGLRSEDTLRVMVPEADDEDTTPAVRGESVSGGTRPDEFTIRGERWQVVALDHHNPTGRYYDALVQRSGRG